MRARNLVLASLLLFGGSVAAVSAYSEFARSEGIGALAASEEHSVVFSDFGWSNAFKPTVIEASGFSIDCTGGSGNKTAYYVSDSTLRFYNGNIFTVTLTIEDAYISKIAFYNEDGKLATDGIKPDSSFSYSVESSVFDFGDSYSSVSFSVSKSVRVSKMIVTSESSTTLDGFSVSLAEEANFSTLSPLSLDSFVLSGVKGDGRPIVQSDFVASIGSGTGDSFVERETVVWGETKPLASDETIRFVSLSPNSSGAYEQAYVSISVSEPLLTAIRLEGDLLNKEYYFLSDWSVDGLSLIAIYNDLNEIEVESGISWSFDPAKPEMGVTEVAVTATYGGKTDSLLISGIVVYDTVVDTLTVETLGLSGNSYQDIDFTGLSGAHYIGRAMYNDGAIQMNANEADRNISTDVSGGTIQKIDIVFASKNQNSIEILASNDPYTSASDHHGDSQTVTTGSESSLSYSFSAEYSYFKIVSIDGAVYINSISVTWGEIVTIDSISINGDEYLELGQSYNYTVSSVPDIGAVGVEWGVDDPTIAYIDENGKLYPKMAGIVEITATLMSNESISASKEVLIDGGEHDYSFSPYDFSTHYEVYEQEMTLDNGLRIAYTNVCQMEHNGDAAFQLYKNAGTFENIDVLAPIESISVEISGSSEPKLTVGHSQTNNEERTIIGNKDGDVITYEIGGDYDYFKVAAGSSTVYFRNFVIRYVSAVEEAAYEWALKFVDNSGLACDPDGITAPSTDQWLERGDEFLSLDASAQEIIKTAQANENGTVIERAVAKYDYIIAKYNPDGTNDDYINYLEREIEPMSAYADALPEGQANESLLLVSALIVCSLAAGVGYLFYRKRRHQA